MTKNPFEIRADVLAMAKDYLDKQTAINAELLKQQMSLGQQLTQQMIDNFKTAYSMDELNKVATNMLAFVNTKQ